MPVQHRDDGIYHSWVPVTCMPSLSRRSFLATLGTATVASLAGCGFGESDLPAGSLQFVNNHDLPHRIGMRVTGVGTEPGDGPNEVTGDPVVTQSQRELTASTTIQPGDTQTYEEIFTYDVWYGIEFTIDGERPGDNGGLARFNPAPTDDERGSILGGTAHEGGDFGWVVSGTDNPGAFEG